MNTFPEITVLMPCLNEAETLESCIRKARSGLEEAGCEGEILIADNGSSDGSPALAESLGARVIHVPEKGYGHALRAGIREARGNYVLMGDADDSYDFSDIRPFIAKLREGRELVMGCRMPRGGGTILPGAMPWKHRWLGNPALSFIGRLFFNCPVTDFHCGLRAFDVHAIRKLNLQTGGMEFASEMVIKASQRKLAIAEVPIVLHKDGRARPPHLRSWRDGWRHLRFMLLFSPRWLFMLPGIILSGLGGFLFLLLMAGPVRVGSVVFDTNTMLAAAMTLLLGFQILYFGVFTRIYSWVSGLSPEQPRLAACFRYFNLERGLLAGSLVTAGGAAFLVAALLRWKERDFGEMDYAGGLRLMIPAVTLVLLGMQMVFGSFFLSILGLQHRE